MRAVRDRAEARWLPSRFRYATFKLLAYFILRRSRPQEQRGLVLIIDRDQSAMEHYTLAVYIMLTVSSYIATVLSFRYHFAIILIASLPIAVFDVEAPLYIAGLFALHKRWVAFQTALSWALLGASALYFALWKSWVRVPAVLFLAVLAANGLASLACRALRGRVAELEKSYGVTP